MTDHQLRSFNISKPWAKSAAQEHSTDAAAAWDLEQSTPQLDQMPVLPQGAEDALQALLQTIPAEETEFSYPLRNTIADKTDQFISKTGDLFLAAHAFTCSWRLNRNPTTLTPAGLSVFEGLVDTELYDHAHKVSSYGVLPCGDRPPERFRQQAYANINDNPEATAAEFWEDVTKGRLMIFTETSEPYTGDLMESKLAYVLQKDATNPDTFKTRYISDPRNEVNDRLANERHPQRIIPRHQNVARRALYWKRRYPTIPILISKRDVKGAFKLVPVSVRGLAYMGCRFAHFVGMYLAMFFGWRCSPANWGVLSSLLMQYVAAFRPPNQFVEGPESFIAFQYVDDGAFVEPWAGLRPWQSVSLWENALITCLRYKALHRKKRDAEGNSSTTLPLWGIVVSTEDETFTLPPEKIDRAREFLATCDYVPGATRIPLGKLQELRGKLEHWSICNQSLATETPYIDRLLRAKAGVLAPRGSLREVKQTYLDFWDCLECIRVQMSTGQYCCQSYVGAFSRVLSLGEILSSPEAQGRMVWLGSDATLSPCAAIDYTAGIASVFSFQFALHYLGHLTGLPETDFLLISISEFLSLLCFLSVRAPCYRGKLLAYAGDNQNVIQWIKYRRPKNRVAQYFCRILNRLETEHSFATFPCYIRSPRNEICDQLSRLDTDECPAYAAKLGVALVETLSVFQWFLAERVANRSLILPSDPPDRAQLVMQFVEKRIAREIPRQILVSAKISFLGHGADAWVG